MRPALPCPDILHEDRHLLVLNKPAGLAVHAGPGRGASVEDWFPLLSRRRDGPWLAHRLDTDTSGCLVIARRKAALIAVQAAFAEGRVRKTYWALCRGRPSANGDEGVIDAPLVRLSTSNGWRMATNGTGSPARTNWRLCGIVGDLCWLELVPRTGRTHQVRVHCAALGCPIVGDPIYGPPASGQGGLRLLARAIGLPLDPEVNAIAPPPPHMRSELEACGWAE